MYKKVLEKKFCTRYNENNFHSFFLLKLAEIALDAGTHEGCSKMNDKPVPAVRALIFLFLVFKSFRSIQFFGPADEQYSKHPFHWKYILENQPNGRFGTFFPSDCFDFSRIITSALYRAITSVVFTILIEMQIILTSDIVGRTFCIALAHTLYNKILKR